MTIQLIFRLVSFNFPTLLAMRSKTNLILKYLKIKIIKRNFILTNLRGIYLAFYFISIIKNVN